MHATALIIVDVCITIVGRGSAEDNEFVEKNGITNVITLFALARLAADIQEPYGERQGWETCC